MLFPDRSLHPEVYIPGSHRLSVHSDPPHKFRQNSAQRDFRHFHVSRHSYYNMENYPES